MKSELKNTHENNAIGFLFFLNYEIILHWITLN